MAGGRSDDPLFIKVPTPDGWGEPYQLVPVDPLKLHLGVITSFFQVDRKDSKHTGGRVIKPVHGPERVVRPFVDTTEISSVLRSEMQNLALELAGDHGEVGVHLVELIAVFEQELPELFEEIGIGSLAHAKPIMNALIGKLRNVALNIASQLSIAEVRAEAAEQGLQALDETRLQMFREWSRATLVIVRALDEVKKLYKSLDDTLTGVRLARKGWSSFEDVANNLLAEALSVIGEPDGTFTLFALQYLSDPDAFERDATLHEVIRAEETIASLRVVEQRTDLEWKKIEQETIVSISEVSSAMSRLRDELNQGYRIFNQYAVQLKGGGLRPYQLEELNANGELVCTKEQFEDAEVHAVFPEWSADGCMNVVGGQIHNIEQILKIRPPRLPETVTRAIQFSEVLIGQIRERLNLKTPSRQEFLLPLPSRNGHGASDLDVQLMQTRYEIICIVGYLKTCNNNALSATNMHSLLHIASKLPQCRGLIEEADIPLLRTPLSERSRMEGERIKVEQREARQTWERVTDVRWVAFQTHTGPRIKFAQCAGPDAIRFMEKHGISAADVIAASQEREQEKKQIYNELRHGCRCYLLHPKSKNEPED